MLDSDSNSNSNNLKDLVVKVLPAGQQIPASPESAVSTAYSPIFSPTTLDAPESPLSDLSPTDEDIRSQQDVAAVSRQDLAKLQLWNATVADPVAAGLHELFMEQARTCPNNEAVNAWDGRMTYDELDRKSTQLARLLLQKGVKPGSVVPTIYEKSIWAVVSMLAALKAGAAFVAVDAAYPAQRIAAMIQQVDTTVVLTSEPHLEKVTQACENKEVIVVDANIFETAQDADTSLPPNNPSSPAYLVFTSGSTGLPKGVVIEQSQASTSILSWATILRMNGATRSFNFSSFAFDASILDIFCPLVVGGCVCIPSEWSRLNDLAGSIAQLQANFGVFTPSLLHTLRHETFDSLDKLLLVGEPISTQVYQNWSAKGKEVFCGYGPAEITLGCTLVDPARDSYYAGFIGRAFNSCLWIVDPADHDVLQPIGEIGELVVEGPIVGSGYAKNAEATQEVFVNAPKWLPQVVKRGQGRFYKTGDLVRYTADGGLEFFGRKDLQIKLHGQRVEIEEIEATMRKVLGPQVELAVDIKTSKLQTSAEALVGFIVLPDLVEHTGDSGMASTLTKEERLDELTNGLSDALRKTLPCYMVPTSYIAIDKLPMTAAAKLDRKQLRSLAIDERRADAATMNKEARALEDEEELSLMERKIKALFLKALPKSVKTVSLDQDFFLLGGDSLSAMNLVSLSRDEGISIDFATVRKAPSIRKLATACSVLAEEDVEYADTIAPYSLVADNIDLSDLKNRAANQLSLEVSQLEDIIPTIAFVTWHVQASTISPGTFQSSLIFAIGDDVDLDRLHAAAEQTFNSHPIFRTRYITLPEGIFHCITNDKVPVQMAPDVDTAVERSKSIGVKETQAVQVYLTARHTDADGTVKPANILVSTHHARWDAIMMQNLCHDIDRRYRNMPVPAPRPFKYIVQYYQNRPIAPSQEFWREHVAGAKYKNLWPMPEGWQPACRNNTVPKELPLKRPQGLDVTIPLNSLVFLAWALVLREMGDGIADVPLNILRSGRIGSATPPGAEGVFSELLQHCPLRVAFGDDHSPPRSTTVFDMLHTIANGVETTRDHPIIDEDSYRSVSPETDSHWKCANMLNFLSLPESVPEDSVVQFPWEIGHAPGEGGGELAIQFVMGGYLRKESVTMVVFWDGTLYGLDVGAPMMRKFERVLEQLCAASERMMVADVVVGE